MRSRVAGSCRQTETHDPSSVPTTAGRAVFNDHLPEQMPYINGLLKKKGLTASGVIDHRATPASRGTERSRWPVERILEVRDLADRALARLESTGGAARRR